MESVRQNLPNKSSTNVIIIIITITILHYYYFYLATANYALSEPHLWWKPTI